MKAAVLSRYHQMPALVDRPVPEPAGPADVLVRIAAAGVCATDLHAIDGLMEAAGVRLPRVLGHENAGWIEATGAGVTTAAAGDPVIIYPAHSCGLCLPCRRGHDMHCTRHQFTGLTVDGGFAEYVVVPERSVIRLPDGVEPRAVAPYADAGITAYHAVRRVADLCRPGTTIVAVGIGGVGHIGLQLLRELGSGRIVAVDTDLRRQRLAHELGADEVVGHDAFSAAVMDLTSGHGADLVIDFVGTDATHAQSVDVLARTGTYSLVGYGGTLHVLSADLVVGEQTVMSNLVGSWPDLWELVQLHAAGRITIRSEQHPLERLDDVLGALRGGDITGRAVVVP